MKNIALIFILCTGSLLSYGQSDISYTRQLSKFKFEKGDDLVVTLKFENETFKKNIRLIELLPRGSEVPNIEANMAKTDLVNEKKLVLNWKNVPANSNTTISYILKATEIQEKNIRLNGAIYVDGHQVFQAKESVLNPTKPVRLIKSD